MARPVCFFYIFRGFREMRVPGSYSYNLGTHSNRWVAVLMRTRAPNMGNYSFWEFEAYNSTTAILNGEPSIELFPAGSLETIILPPSE